MLNSPQNRNSTAPRSTRPGIKNPKGQITSQGVPNQRAFLGERSISRRYHRPAIEASPGLLRGLREGETSLTSENSELAPRGESPNLYLTPGHNSRRETREHRPQIIGPPAENNWKRGSRQNTSSQTGGNPAAIESAPKRPAGDPPQIWPVRQRGGTSPRTQEPPKRSSAYTTRDTHIRHGNIR